MKIAMENLQQKVEEKEKERSKIRIEFKSAILELKQDKKRYEELLDIREAELERVTQRLKKVGEG